MITEDNFTAGPQLAVTVDAPVGSLPSDRWTGSTLGKYQIIRRLGHGGMGVVYEAIDPILQRAVAIKVLREGLANQPDAVRKFLREARTAARLNHPHVVAVYDTNEEKGMCYLVMELMEGGSAYDRIRKWGSFGWVEATQVMVDACRGLIAVHFAGLIHRDIKPSNIMRTKDGIVKLADFGLAFALASTNPADSSTPNGQVVGTPLYMSPEQCRAENIDVRSDIYAMGATYYSLMTSQPPFDGKSPLDVMYGHCSEPVPDICDANPHVHTACADLIRRALAKIPTDRPASAAALLVEFEAILALASSPEVKPLNWATENGVAISIAPTVADALTPVDKLKRTRLWFVGVCFMLMGVAFGVGRFYSKEPTPPVNNDPPIGDPTVASDEKPNLAKQGDVPQEATQVVDAGGPVTSIAFDPNDKTLVSWGTSNGKQHIYNLIARESRSNQSVTGPKSHPILQVGYSPIANEKLWVSLFHDELHFFETWKFHATLERSDYEAVQGKRIAAIAFHPKEKILAMAVADESPKTQGGIVVRWLLPKPIDVERQTDDQQLPTCLAFSTDGKLLLTGKQSGILQTWNVELRKRIDGSEERELLVKRIGTIPIGNGFVTALATIDDTTFAVAIGKQIVLCDGQKGVKSSVLHSGEKPVTALAVCPLSRRLACANDRTIFVYDLLTKTQVKQLTATDTVTALAFDAQGEQLAFGGKDGKITVQRVEVTPDE